MKLIDKLIKSTLPLGLAAFLVLGGCKEKYSQEVKVDYDGDGYLDRVKVCSKYPIQEVSFKDLTGDGMEDLYVVLEKETGREKYSLTRKENKFENKTKDLRLEYRKVIFVEIGNGRRSDNDDDFLDPTNPFSPVSPLNPTNPGSPLHQTIFGN